MAKDLINRTAAPTYNLPLLGFQRAAAGHGTPGVKRTLSLIQERFYFSKMQKDIEHLVTNVCEFLKKKKPTKQTQVLMKPIHTTRAFKLVRHLDKCMHGYGYLLVVMYHFTRFAQVFATRNKSAKTVAAKIFNDYALKLGFPSKAASRYGEGIGEQTTRRTERSLRHLWITHHALPPTREWAGRGI